MKRLIFSGECIETGTIVNGSLIQFEDGTHTIMFKESDGKGITTPVNPETIIPVSLYDAMEKYNIEVVAEPDAFNHDYSEENKHISQIDHLLDLM